MALQMMRLLGLLYNRLVVKYKEDYVVWPLGRRAHVLSQVLTTPHRSDIVPLYTSIAVC